MKCEICGIEFDQTRNNTTCGKEECKKEKERRYQAEYYKRKLKGNQERLRKMRERYAKEKEKNSKKYQDKLKKSKEQYKNTKKK